ncbi:MAG: hypothetical protein KGM96_01420 [Acidobacteriota bacterium]|nr:hypothetical protein [Acidobacteriota bacterium]
MAYITAIPALYFLLARRYKKRPYVRFHCWQAIYLLIASVLITIVLGVISNVIPALRFLNFDHFPLDSLALVILWIVVLIKAFNGEWYKIPIIGSMAERKARR